MLLCGLSVEVAIKGHLLWERPEDVIFKLKARGTGEIFENEVVTIAGRKFDHDLLGLVGESEFKKTMTDELETALRRLSRLVQWAGRYPGPKSIGELKDPKTDDSSQSQLQGSWDASDRDAVRPLLEAILGPDQITASPRDEFIFAGVQGRSTNVPLPIPEKYKQRRQAQP
jgi:hypothetical protein